MSFALFVQWLTVETASNSYRSKSKGYIKNASYLESVLIAKSSHFVIFRKLLPVLQDNLTKQ